ncbi:MAG TPA: hypothetical protein VJV79_18765 [Polyangiaceae bacterium]|nr:hypothetical protein [Polyangiaceae bacterium]
MRLPSVLWVLPALLVGCGDAGDVSLTVHSLDEAIVVKNGAFGETVSGRFALRFVLGRESSADSTEVSLGTFSLQSASGTPLVEVLDVNPEFDFPYRAAKGNVYTSGFIIPSVGVEQGVMACPGPVRIVGALMDSLKGGTVPLRSNPITPDCSQ